MQFSEYFPIYEKLTDRQKELLQQSVVKRKVPAGTLLHNGSEYCMGLLVICSGQLRAYINSDEGREITVYRLFERDVP